MSCAQVVQIYEKMYPVPAEAPIVRHAPNNPDRQLVVINNKSFRTMVCYDIIFPAAYYRQDVHHWLFTTKWTSARDLISILIQQAFSRATQSVLAGSNVNVPYPDGLHGANYRNLVGTGSGIYIGGRAVASHFGLVRDDTPHRGFPLLQEIDMNAVIPKAFPDDNVNIHAARAALPLAQAPARRHSILCAGQGCPPCVGNVVNCEKINLNTLANPQFDLVAGDLTCHFDIRIHPFGQDRPAEYFIAQADMFISDRRTRSCVFAKLAGADIADWTKFGPEHIAPSNVRFVHVQIRGNNLGSNTAVLPVVGIRGDEQQPVKPFPSGDAVCKLFNFDLFFFFFPSFFKI